MASTGRSLDTATVTLCVMGVEKVMTRCRAILRERDKDLISNKKDRTAITWTKQKHLRRVKVLFQLLKKIKLQIFDLKMVTVQNILKEMFLLLYILF